MNIDQWRVHIGLVLALGAGLAACAPATAPEPAEAPAMATAAEPAAEPTAEATAEAHAGGDAAVHWSYEGEAGPEHWGELSPANEACGSGMAQSPIDIAGFTEQDLANIVFHYQPSKVNILNNGHTIQVDYDPGSYIELDGKRFDLGQYHFHAPSEHTIAGKPAAAELHLVHSAADKSKAVVGVMIEEGAANPAFDTVWANLPAEETAVTTLDAETMAADMLPAQQATYRYDGSLTTPPCTEGVKWNVMATPIEMSAEQLAAFSAIISANNRPVQPLGSRTLVEDTTP